MKPIYNLKTIDAIKDILIKREQTIAVAESVTSGHLQAAFSLADNARLFFQGGVTTYNLGHKCKLLYVEPTHAQACNCVSDKVSEQMAIQVCNLFLSDWGLAVTGYAAPIPEIPAEDLHAFYVISFKGKVVKKAKIKVSKKLPDSLEVQLFFTNKILDGFSKALRDNIQNSNNRHNPNNKQRQSF